MSCPGGGQWQVSETESLSILTINGGHRQAVRLSTSWELAFGNADWLAPSQCSIYREPHICFMR